jgi:hypothetical protein
MKCQGESPTPVRLGTECRAERGEFTGDTTLPPRTLSRLRGRGPLPSSVTIHVQVGFTIAATLCPDHPGLPPPA